jgi:CubicO group peptidase (beta-lactamase class C family)
MRTINVKIWFCICIIFSGIVYSQEVYSKLDNYFSTLEQYGFSGVVLVSTEGKMVINKGYGYADYESRQKNSKHNVFSTGSVTKQFTAAAIMKLEMMGKLKTSDNLKLFFENVPSDKADITVHNLLTHTSGLPIAFDDDDFARISKQDFIKQALSTKLLFQPGNDFQYSNVAYSLAAAIIEKISGQSYEQFLNKYLFQPAGMKFTGYSIPKWDKDLFVSIYDGDKNNGSTELFTNPTWHLIGNGGILSTADDMFRWIKALQGDDILSEEAKAKMFTPFRNEYAYGWDVIDDGALRQHDGGSTLGLSAELRWYVEEDIVSIIFTNSTIQGSLGFPLVRDDLEAIIFGDPIILPPKISVVNRNLSPYAGKYQISNGNRFEIHGNSTNLFIEVDIPELVDFFLSENQGSNNKLKELKNKFQNGFHKVITLKETNSFDFLKNSKALEQEIKNEIEMEGLLNPKYKIMNNYVSNSDQSKIITKVALNDNENFEGESIILSIVTQGNEYLGMGVDFGFAGPITLTLYPINTDEFQAYNLMEKKGVTLKMTVDNENITFSSDKLKLTAKKL